jgi:chromosome partitioning protein
MDIVAFLSQKGGSGKTTLALHIAVAAEQAGQATVVVDLDPQASASAWGDSREAETPAVVASPASRLNAVLDAAREGGAGLCLIDTSPASESSTLVAARAADLLLIPCRPAILDLRAIGNTIDLGRIAGKPCAVILNAVPPRAAVCDDARRAVEGYGVEVAPVTIGQRSAFAQSLALGQIANEYDPRGKASYEIQFLYTWIRKKMGKAISEKATTKPRRRSP